MQALFSLQDCVCVCAEGFFSTLQAMTGHLESIQHGLSLYGGNSQLGCSLNHQGVTRILPSRWELWCSCCHFWLSTLQIPGHTSCLETRKYKMVCGARLKANIQCNSQDSFSVSYEEPKDNVSCNITGGFKMQWSCLTVRHQGLLKDLVPKYIHVGEATCPFNHFLPKRGFYQRNIVVYDDVSSCTLLIHFLIKIM